MEDLPGLGNNWRSGSLGFTDVLVNLHCDGVYCHYLEFMSAQFHNFVNSVFHENRFLGQNFPLSLEFCWKVSHQMQVEHYSQSSSGSARLFLYLEIENVLHFCHSSVVYVPFIFFLCWLEARFFYDFYMFT